jgi:hypothetical protein
MFLAVQEFLSQADSLFGQTLLEYAHSLDNAGFDQPDFLSQACFMNPANFTWETKSNLTMVWGNASVVTTIISDAWLKVTSSLSMMDAWKEWHSWIDSPMMPMVIDSTWFQIDQVMWEAAKRFDRPGQSGRVAKELGLINPYDPNRPTFTEYIFSSLDPKHGTIEPAKTPAPAPSPFIESIRMATSNDAAVQSGHAFRAEKLDSLPKPKIKTRGKDLPPDNMNIEDTNDDDADRSTLPESLPTGYKLGKKVLKVPFISQCLISCIRNWSTDFPSFA